MRSWSVKETKTGANPAWETTGQGRLLQGCAGQEGTWGGGLAEAASRVLGQMSLGLPFKIHFVHDEFLALFSSFKTLHYNIITSISEGLAPS